ncbi:MAG: PDDEXK nuclease domain-containing protein [Kiritimatiellia bacterium]|nr:PDDEXK nuclease domain-containing protein [Kiritimatiellia bacterium]
MNKKPHITRTNANGKRRNHLRKSASSADSRLFDRVISILEQARSNVVRAVNSNMVVAYWLIGREIVQALQGGEERAEYGQQVIENLSARLTERYGKGFSTTNLKYFRLFYKAYPTRLVEIRHPPGDELALAPKSHPAGDELINHGIPHPVGTELGQDFSPQLSWSHYRALMRVENVEARDFYEREAVAGGWDKRTLERQIHSYYYERILKSRKPQKMLEEGRHLPVSVAPAGEELKNPYVLEFLGLPEVAALRESDMEHSILSHLQRFLLELGNGFAFVARQKHIRIEEQDRFIDLVFYHCRLKFYLLIDLKVGELSHADVGQMDGYVRMYDDLFVASDDNPTIGLILCTEKNETVARYSVLNDRKQIFASKYMLCLPTEDQLRIEIEKERRLIEAAQEERSDD